jgi:hypothetical protein
LPVHDATRAERIAHTLVDAVAQGNIDIVLEGFQAALPNRDEEAQSNTQQQL